MKAGDAGGDPVNGAGGPVEARKGLGAVRHGRTGGNRSKSAGLGWGVRPLGYLADFPLDSPVRLASWLQPTRRRLAS